jgi:excisionase family DNA binding protein
VSAALEVSESAFLTVEELATLLRVNHKTIRDAIKRREIPGVRRIGTAFRIHRATVLDWFASQDRVARKATNERTQK